MHPFIGGKYDVQHDGVFTAIKNEAHHFEVQQQIVYCRPAQPWSGGLTVKCNDGLAVRIDKDHVLETSKSNQKLKLNGVALPKGTKTVGDVTIKAELLQKTDSKGGLTLTYSEHQITSPHFKILFDTNSLLTRFFISLKARSWYGHSPGLCGGGGAVQYKQVPHAERADDNQAEVVNGGSVIGYPCQHCVAGIGYVGAMCRCKEFLVAPDKQLFQKKQALPEWHHSEWRPPDASTTNTVESMKRRCLAFLDTFPAGRLAYSHPALKPMVVDAIDECAQDREAGVGPVHFDRESLLEEVCDESDYMIREKNPSVVLCKIADECKQNGNLEEVAEKCSTVAA